MKMNLFISFQRGYIKRKGIPLNDDIILFDTFDVTKRSKFYTESEWRTLEYKEILFPPTEYKYKFPSKLYLVFKKKQKEILFNYIEFGSNVKILSYELYELLSENGLSKDQYEVSEVKLVDKNCNEISNRKFLALRFGKFDDDLFDFHKQTSIRTKIHGSTNYLYPDLELKQISRKKVFVLKEFSYNNSLIFEGMELVNEIRDLFSDFNIYKIIDFPFIYMNQYDENISPIDNDYKV